MLRLVSMVQLLLLLIWQAVVLILSLMTKLRQLADLRLLVLSVMNQDELITSSEVVPEDRVILVSQDSTFLLKMIL